jgi:hypothetical protein
MLNTRYIYDISRLRVKHTIAERCLTNFLQGMCRGNEIAGPQFEDICRYQTKCQMQGIFFAATLS